jgi:hypothetical protein
VGGQREGTKGRRDQRRRDQRRKDQRRSDRFRVFVAAPASSLRLSASPSPRLFLPPRMLGDHGPRVARPEPDAVAATRFEGALQVVQITPQGVDVEHFQPVAAGGAVDLLNAIDELLLAEHGREVSEAGACLKECGRGVECARCEGDGYSGSDRRRCSRHGIIEGDTCCRLLPMRAIVHAVVGGALCMRIGRWRHWPRSPSRVA